MRFRTNERHMTQEENIENLLLRGDSITPIEALHRFGIFRLAAIVHTLRQKGLKITTTMIDASTNRKFAEYKMVSE